MTDSIAAASISIWKPMRAARCDQVDRVSCQRMFVIALTLLVMSACCSMTGNFGPGQSKYVGFAVGSSRQKSKTIVMLCDDAGLPRKAR